MSLALLAAGLSIAGPAARADVILFDPDGAGGVNSTRSVGSFGFETGNTLARAAIANGQLVGVGSTFQLFLQTRLANLTLSPGGATDTPAGLNGSAGGPPFEITLVASITEVVTSIAPGGGTATFATAPTQSAESFIRMWHHNSLTSDNFTGNGFTVGAGSTLILAGTPNAALGSSGSFTVSVNNATPPTPVGVGAFDQFDPPSSAPGVFYSGKTSVSGSGGANLAGNVTFVNPNFFLTPVVSVRFDAFNNVPFVATTPSQAFNNIGNTPAVVANIGNVNGVSGPDFQFQSRTTAVFAVPEPASAGLMALGVLGVIGISWRKRRQPA